jgi:dTMP kinase
MTGNGQEKKRGFFIVVEGIDGTGKTTFVRNLGAALTGKGVRAVTTFEPTRGRYGIMLRESFSAPERLSPEEECRLFTLDREEHVRKFILPHLERGDTVICDRYYFSTMAYQGARGLDTEEIRKKNRSVAPEPDLLFILELDPELAAKRITAGRGEKLNNFEQVAYLDKVDRIFRAMTECYIRRIDASMPPEEMAEKAMEEIDRACRKEACDKAD